MLTIPKDPGSESHAEQALEHQSTTKLGYCWPEEVPSMGNEQGGFSEDVALCSAGSFYLQSTF